MIEFLEKNLEIPNHYRPLLSKSISTFSFKTIWSSIFGISFNSDDVVPHNHKVGKEKKMKEFKFKNGRGTTELLKSVIISYFFRMTQTNVIGLDQYAILKYE